MEACKTAALVLLATLCCGCASTISNPAGHEEVTFEVGATHKNEIAEALGFPQFRDVVDGIEYWGYRSKPQLTGVIYAVPTGSHTVTTYHASTVDGPRNMEAASVIYAFTSAGTLTDVHELDRK